MELFGFDDKKADSASCYTVLAVDPGEVNLGIAVMQLDDGVFWHRYAANIQPLPRGHSKQKPPMRAIVRSIYQHMRLVLQALKVTPDMVLIEDQFGHRQASVAHAVQGIFLGMGCDVEFRAPRKLARYRTSIETFHQIHMPDPPTRMKLPRTIAKWRSVQLFRALWPDNKFLKSSIKLDDVADAFIYAYSHLIEQHEQTLTAFSDDSDTDSN